MRLRRAGDEDDAAAVPVDVALEEGDAELVGRSLDRPRERVERRRRALGTLSLDQIVDLLEADEGDGRLPVLRFERPNLEQLRP